MSKEGRGRGVEGRGADSSSSAEHGSRATSPRLSRVIRQACESEVRIQTAAPPVASAFEPRPRVTIIKSLIKADS